MAINPNEEMLISLTEAAELLPARRSGKRPHVSTLYRWTLKGCRGVVLESLQAGGTRVTSREALARFCQRLTDARVPSPPSDGRGRSRDDTDVERKLTEAGI